MLPKESQTPLLTRREAETSPNHGFWYNKRPIDELLKYGIVNIDKPKGPTSHQVSAYAQKILRIPKAGHAGTLDPGVTGCLPIALQRATRILQLLLKAGKEYICLMHVHADIASEQITDVVNQFKGEIEQLPPKRSAVKRQLRKRNIYALDLMEIDGRDVLFRVECQAGTYIRKLCHDIGERLESGAHMAELRRSRSSFFDESSITTLQNLADAYHYYTSENDETPLRRIIHPCEIALRDVPKIWIFDQTIDSLCHGASLAAVGVSCCTEDVVPDELVAILSLKGELVSFGKALMNAQDIITAAHGLAAESHKVFMEPETYPKYRPE